MTKRKAWEYAATASLVLCALAAIAMVADKKNALPFGVASVVFAVAFMAFTNRLYASLKPRSPPDTAMPSPPVESTKPIEANDQPATHRAAS